MNDSSQKNKTGNSNEESYFWDILKLLVNLLIIALAIYVNIRCSPEDSPF